MTRKKIKRKKEGLELIRLLCSCGKRVKVSLKFAGKVGTCPKCGKPVNIPSLEVIKQKLSEIKGEEPSEINFDIPSLPDLKEIVLEESDSKEEEEEEEAKGPRKKERVPRDYVRVQIQETVKALHGPQDSLARTSEELIVDDSKKDSPSSLAFSKDAPWIEEIEPEESPTQGIDRSPQKEELEIPQPETIEMEEEEIQPQVIESDSSDTLPASQAQPDETLPIEEEELEAEEALLADADQEEEGMDVHEEAGMDVHEEAGMDVHELIEEQAFEDIQQAMAIEESDAQSALAVEDHFHRESGEEEQIELEEIEEINSDITIEGASELMEALPVAERRMEIPESLDLKEVDTEEEISGGPTLIQGKKALDEMKLDEALQYLCTCINTGESVEMAYYLRALVFIKKKAWALAIEEMENAKELGCPESRTENRMNQILFQLAIEYRNIGAYQEALNALDRISGCQVDVEKGKVHWARAKFLMRHGAFEKALKDIEETISNNYLRPEVFEARGRIYMEQRDHEAAMHDFTAAISRGGKSASIFHARSEAYFFLGELDLALEDIQNAQRLAPEDPCLYDLEGLILNQKRMYEKADLSFEKALEFNSDNAIHYFNRGVAYMWRGRYDKAVEDFSRVIQMDPNDRNAYLKRAICYQEKTNPNLIQAREDFKKAEQLDQSSFYRTHKPHSARKEFH